MPLQIWFHQDNTSTVQCRRHFHSYSPFASPSSNWLSLQLSYLSSDITRRDSHDTHPTETFPGTFGPFQLRRLCTFRHFRNLRAEMIERKRIRELCRHKWFDGLWFLITFVQTTPRLFNKSTICASFRPCICVYTLYDVVNLAFASVYLRCCSKNLP